jgi:hypothetical protein
MLVFVDKPGSNKCKVGYGHVDEQIMLILPKDSSQNGMMGAKPDMQSIVLSFVAGTGEAINVCYFLQI